MNDLLLTLSVDAALLAQTLETLPARLRRKLDADASTTQEWTARHDGDAIIVDAGDDVALTVRAVDGAIRDAGQLVCSCLLAPACLHRGALLVSLPVDTSEPPPADPAVDHVDGAAHDGRDAVDQGQSAMDSNVAAPTTTMAVEVSAQQLAAASAVWNSAAPLVTQGIVNSGALRLAELLRAANLCRSTGMHVLSRSAIRMAEHIKRRNTSDASFVLADACDDLRLVLRDAWNVMHGFADQRDLGSGRRKFESQGGLRLFALACEPVIAASGYAGVVTHLVDSSGETFHLSEVMPGGGSRVRAKYATAVRIGDTNITHEKLSRAGLVISGATVAPDGRLGAGANVRAAAASPVALEPQSADRFSSAIRSALANEEPRRLLVARVRILGSTTNGIFVEVFHNIGNVSDKQSDTPSGDSSAQTQAFTSPESRVMQLVPATENVELPAISNLQLLAKQIDLELVIVGDVVPGPVPSARLLAFSPCHVNDFALPDSWVGRCNAGIDRLEPGMFRYRSTSVAGGVLPVAAVAVPSSDARRVLERITAVGTLALQNTATRDLNRCVDGLASHGLARGSAIFDRLITGSRGKDREVDGRLRPPAVSTVAAAWLAGATWEHAFRHQIATNAWHLEGP
jgi:hypothetical protein